VGVVPVVEVVSFGVSFSSEDEQFVNESERPARRMRLKKNPFFIS